MESIVTSNFNLTDVIKEQANQVHMLKDENNSLRGELENLKQERNAGTRSTLVQYKTNLNCVNQPEASLRRNNNCAPPPPTYAAPT